MKYIGRKLRIPWRENFLGRRHSERLLKVNNFMNLLETLIEKTISECEYSGVLGGSDGAAFSGDVYAKGDVRTPKILGPVITRQGTVQSRNHKKRHNKKKQLTN